MEVNPENLKTGKKLSGDGTDAGRLIFPLDKAGEKVYDFFSG